MPVKRGLCHVRLGDHPVHPNGAVSFAVKQRPRHRAANDAAAKATVKTFAAKEFGWETFADLGDIAGVRASEGVLPIWLRLWMTTGSPMVNLHVVKG